MLQRQSERHNNRKWFLFFFFFFWFDENEYHQIVINGDANKIICNIMFLCLCEWVREGGREVDVERVEARRRQRMRNGGRRCLMPFVLKTSTSHLSIWFALERRLKWSKCCSAPQCTLVMVGKRRCFLGTLSTFTSSFNQFRVQRLFSESEI